MVRTCLLGCDDFDRADEVRFVGNLAKHIENVRLLEKLGGDSLAEMLPRFATLRQARLADLPQDNFDHIWWPE